MPSKPKSINITWEPQKGPQTAFFTCPAFELLYGGAAGGGKSEALIVQAVANCVKYPNYRAILFRRTFPEIQKSLVPRVSYFIYSAAKSRNQGLEWNFPNGSVLYLSHLQREDDKEKHKSSEYDYIGFDELTSFAKSQYEYLFTRCRGTTPVPRMVRAATNPSGAGHGWVRERFVDFQRDETDVPIGLSPDGLPLPYDYAYGWLANHQVYTDFSNLPDDFRFGEPAFEERSYQVWKDKNSKLTRAFIPALLWCNAKLLKADPEYVLRMRSQDEKTQKALLYGSWDVYEGQFFSTWNPDVHVVDAFSIPESWRRYVGIDYGYTAPAAALWFAVDNDGIIHAYREMYGTKMTTSEQARSIIEMTGDEKIEWYAADPSMFSKTGAGESHAQIYHREGVPILPSSNKRIPGWALFHEVLASHRIKIFRNCVNLARTIPTLTHGTNPEDLDSSQEDHCFVGSTLIDTFWGKKRIDSLVGKFPLVNTMSGFERARSVRQTRETEVWKIELSTGEIIICTPDHRFFTINGWKELRDIDIKIDLLIRSDIWYGSYLKLFRNLTAKGIIFAVNIFRKMVVGCISPFGKLRMGKRRRAFTFIIKTMTDLIIIFQILKRFLRKSILFFTPIFQKLLSKLREIGSTWKKFVLSLPLGIDPKLEENGIVNTRKVLQKTGSVLKKSVLCVVSGIRHLLVSRGDRNTAVSIVAKWPFGREKVYDLTVPSTAHFTIHNGIVVHNCVDALRYFLLTLRGAHTPKPRVDDGGVPDWFTDRVKARKKIIQRVRI